MTRVEEAEHRLRIAADVADERDRTTVRAQDLYVILELLKNLRELIGHAQPRD